MGTKSIFDKKSCTKCNVEYPIDYFIRTPSKFIDSETSPICSVCLEELVDFENLEDVDRLCRWADLPFVPDEWIRIYKENPVEVLRIYSNVVVSGEYQALDWSSVNDFWQSELNKGKMFENIQELRIAFVDKMKIKWQLAASYEEFIWLETFYNDMSKIQNMKNPAIKDILQKISKLALQINRLQQEDPIDIKAVKDLTSVYNNMLKTSGFLDEGNYSADTIDSFAKAYQVMEKNGFQPTFYDGEAKDFADKTIDDIKKTIKRLILGDTTIPNMLEMKLKAAGIPLNADETDDASDFEEELNTLKSIQANRKKQISQEPKNKVVDFSDE